MTFLFICGSAQPGKDGVGDYTRRLCGNLSSKGHKTIIVALCNNHSKLFFNERQEIEGNEILVYHIPVYSSVKQRFIWCQSILNEFQPDWISLQFVPYSFNPKGLPFWLPSFLKKLRGDYKWHIMFHELWIGMDTESSLKHKCIGRVQQLIVKKIVTNTNPTIIATQIKLYQFFLNCHKIKAELLPICGNIPVKTEKKETLLFTQFVLFGTIHRGAPFSDFVEDLFKNSKSFNKPLKFVFVGKNGIELDNYLKVLEDYHICYDVLGIQSEKAISQVLINSDFGLSTTPYFQTEKSGVYAAYKEHKLSTICVARKWTPSKGKYHIPYIIKYKKNKLKLKEVEIEMFDLDSMALQFMRSILR